MEIIVDAYDVYEQRAGWYAYLEDRLRGFRARCVAERATSPLAVGDVVEVRGLAPDDDCRCEMVVLAEWHGRTLGVPLAQLEAVGASEETETAVDDWRYWDGRGYQLC